MKNELTNESNTHDSKVIYSFRNILSEQNLIALGIYDDMIDLYESVRNEMLLQFKNSTSMIDLSIAKKHISNFVQRNNNIFHSTFILSMNFAIAKPFLLRTMKLNAQRDFEFISFELFTKELLYIVHQKIYSIEVKTSHVQSNKTYKISLDNFLNHLKEKINANLQGSTSINYSLMDNPKTIWVYSNFDNLKCKQDNHEIVAKTAIVEALNSTFKLNIPINHCLNCDEYFIGKHSLKHIQNEYGVLLVKLRKYMNIHNTDTDFTEFNAESELHSYGYNVVANGLKDYERQKLLSYLLENKIMSKFSVRRDIEKALNIFGNRDGYLNAQAAWKRDLSFVDNHGNDECIGDGKLIKS